ncbi:MAG: large-conductance mechanosensitive channel protein MscL [Bacilli bacterium]
MKKIIKEFKEFISRGSVIDLAVGIIIGGAFTAIVSSLVNDIIMPLISLLLGKINFTDMKWILIKATETTGIVSINYGEFIQAIINFLITAFAIFILIKFINHFRKKEKEEKVVSKDILLLTEIRDLLKNS